MSKSNIININIKTLFSLYDITYIDIKLTDMSPNPKARHSLIKALSGIAFVKWSINTSAFSILES